MILLRYLLVFTGIGLLVGAAAILVWDLYQILKSRRQPLGKSLTSPEFFTSPESLTSPEFLAPLESQPYAIRWKLARQLAICSLPPLLTGWSIEVVPSGSAGVRVNQFSGTRPATLYPGVHWTIPFIEEVDLYSTRDGLFSTATADESKKVTDSKGKSDAMRVQTREGLMVGLAATVRYRLDPAKLAYIHSNLPQPVEQELIAPAVASAFRDLAPGYLVRELFSTRRDEFRQTAGARIAARLGADGIVVKEVVLRDIELPAEYSKGLEGLLLKEQENERMNIDLEVKKKQVETASLEAEAQKARDVRAAEARAQVVVLDAKAQADAMQHTLPLKEKQIQQSRLEAEARKEATVKNAEAMAQAKVIDSKAEVEKRKLMSESDEYRIRRVASADSERMKLEADALKDNPMLIQKIIAEKLSDKVQIMMVPADGKFFFANDVLKGTPAPTIVH
jgi:regulator of protease activity HflC (stomatin/prohibitin superfamily)